MKEQYRIMTFNDIFKSSFLDNVSSISILDMVLTIVLSFGIGLFIFLIYKKTYRGDVFHRVWNNAHCSNDDNFHRYSCRNLNVVLSLGMVGALDRPLSCCNQDPLDIAFCSGLSLQASSLRQA